MEIKNFTASFSSGRAKILTAILGCLAIFCAAIILSGVATDKNIVVAYTFHDNICVTAYDTTKDVEKSTCNGFAEGDYACYDGYDGFAVRCNGRYWKDVKSWFQAGCYCKSQYKNYTHIEYGKDINMASAAPEAEESPTVSSGTACKNAGPSADVGREDPACGSNEFCFSDNRCAKGCKTADGRGIKYNTTTCEKPSYLSVDGVYKCTYAVDEKVADGKPIPLRYGSGAISSVYPQYHNSYQLKLQGDPCYSGCNSSTAQCNNENNCANMAGSIIAAFKTYIDGVNNIITTGSCASIPKIAKQLDADTCYNDLKAETQKKILILSDKSGIIPVFEKLAFPGERKTVNGFSLFVAPAGYNKITSLTQNDILCAPRRDLSKWQGQEVSQNEYFKVNLSEDYRCINEKSKMSSPFRGYSFRCEVKSGCGVYSWLLNQNSDKCGTTNVDVFGHNYGVGKDKGYFCNSGTKENPIHSAGWSGDRGADEYGCAYYSVSFLNDKADGAGKNPLTSLYYESKIYTGKCYKNDTTLVNLPNCTSYFQGAGETETPSAGECSEIAFTDKCQSGSPQYIVTTGGKVTKQDYLGEGYADCNESAIQSIIPFVKGECLTPSFLDQFKNNCQNARGKCAVVEAKEQCPSTCINNSDCAGCGTGWGCANSQCVAGCVGRSGAWFAPGAYCNSADSKKLDNCFGIGSPKEQFVGGWGGSVICTSYCDKNAAPNRCAEAKLTFKCDESTGQVAVTDGSGEKSFIGRAEDCDQLNLATAIEKTACKQQFPCGKEEATPGTETGECRGITVSKGNAFESAGGSCGKGQTCSGICVPFNVKADGNCSSIVCKITNDYDDYVAIGEPNDRSNPASTLWYACIKPKTSSQSSGGSAKSGGSGGVINYEINCRDEESGQSSGPVRGSCGFPQGTENPYNKEQEEKQKEEEQKEEDSKAPNVNISSPSGTITTKTAQLSVTTDIAANCKYMLNQEGGLSAGNFDGAGMVLSGTGGTSHNATLSNLTNIQATNCKYNHSVTVLCKNSKASAGATGAIGSAQANFSVDLSQDSSNAPVVVAVMESKYTIANPVLKVTTDRPADCEYKKDGDFTFGGGNKFDTTGSYAHNTQLNDLKAGDYTYYVVCQDKTTCAANKPGLSVRFKVDLSEDPANAPNIVNTTPETQTVANPTLSVTTDRPATCQYKKDATFTYDGGTQFANDGEYAHSVSLADLPDGKHTFYVACKDKSSGAKKTLETAIVTTLNRGGTAGAPVISNTTPPSQNTNNPTLSVITDRPATCQYKQDADFVYGQGMQFTIDGGTGHSAVLANAADGTYTFYVVCQDPTTQISNVPGAQIIFTVNTASEVCASLSSNDKQNDNERDYSDEDDYNSIYVWRSVAAGTVESFEKVDWHAGYQLTPEKDGYVTQLCGYFDSGARNQVSLYDGNYKELAGVEIDGQGGWNCAGIAPAAIKANKRYYVIARVQDDAIYFAYKSGLLPRDAKNAVIESGIRQLGADGKFGESLKKYDYIVFGLVDAKIRFAEDNSRGPQVSSPLPDGNREKRDVVLSAATNEDATCKFDREDIEYRSMRYTFGATGQKLHQQKICSLDDGPFTWYVRCKGATDTNDGSTPIQFKVDD